MTLVTQKQFAAYLAEIRPALDSYAERVPSPIDPDHTLGARYHNHHIELAGQAVGPDNQLEPIRVALASGASVDLSDIRIEREAEHRG